MLMRQRMPEGVKDSPAGRYAPSDLERAWVARIAAGEIGAFEVVFGLHYESLCSFALQFVSSSDALVSPRSNSPLAIQTTSG